MVAFGLEIPARSPNSRTFENTCERLTAHQLLRIFEFGLEAPPGFEPGMEVLQI
jgi:hypothetical protein